MYYYYRYRPKQGLSLNPNYTCRHLRYVIPLDMIEGVSICKYHRHSVPRYLLFRGREAIPY